MRRRFLALASLLCGCSSFPRQKGGTAGISVARYEVDSGPVLPERQWHVRVDVSRDGVAYTRSGKVPGSPVNAGSWEIGVDGQGLESLLAALDEVDCRALRRVEPSDVPDGGGTETFSILYRDGSACQLRYDPGVTYEGGEAITAPMRAFVEGLQLPAEAATTYRAE